VDHLASGEFHSGDWGQEYCKIGFAVVLLRSPGMIVMPWLEVMAFEVCVRSSGMRYKVSSYPLMMRALAPVLCIEYGPPTLLGVFLGGEMGTCPVSCWFSSIKGIQPLEKSMNHHLAVLARALKKPVEFVSSRVDLIMPWEIVEEGLERCQLGSEYSRQSRTLNGGWCWNCFEALQNWVEDTRPHRRPPLVGRRG
jgi:hypothetical protein